MAQVISRSIQLDELITNLTKIILENAGAKKCVLILPDEDKWQIQAITSINPSDQQLTTVLISQPLDGCQEVPVKLIQYVKHTLEPLVIDNCQTEISGVIDDYMLQYQPKSALCIPILNQGHLVGIIYLENSLTQGIFTIARLVVINFLCTQAAISLENARLYQQAQQALQDLQKAQLQLVQSEKMSALGNLIADNGNGMVAEVKQRIFDHLFTTKAVGQGTGLGLAIARQIVVEKHGGQIIVESEVGKGTQFALVIPVK